MNGVGERANNSELLRARADLIQAAETLAGVTTELGDTFNAAGLRLLIPRLRQGLIRVAVIGATSSGKSTLINALLQNLVVPENPNVSSPIPVWIGYEQGEPRVTIYKSRETDPDQVDCEECGIERFQVEYCYNAEHIKNRDIDQFSRIRYGAVGLESECLRQGLVLIDTLGISATDIDTAKTHAVLEEGVDLVLFVTKNASFTQAEHRFLRTYVLGKGDRQVTHPVAPRNILFAINPFGLKPQPVKAAVEGSIREALAPCHLEQEALDAILRDNVFYVHALKGRYGTCGPYPYVERAPAGSSEKERFALGKKQEEEQKYFAGHDRERLVEESGIRPLREALASHVLRQSYGTDSAVVRRIRELTDIAANLQLAASNRLIAAAAAAVVLEKVKTECNIQRTSIEKEKQQISTVLDRFRGDYISSLSQVYTAAQTRITQECIGFAAGHPMPDAFKIKWGAFRQLNELEKQQYIQSFLPPLKDKIQHTCTDAVLSMLANNAPGEVLEQTRQFVQDANASLSKRVKDLEQSGAPVIGVSLPTQESIDLLYGQMNSDLEEGASRAINHSLTEAGHKFQKEMESYIKTIKWGWLGMFDFLPHRQKAFWNKVCGEVLVPMVTGLMGVVAEIASNSISAQSQLSLEVGRSFDRVRDKLRDNLTHLSALVDIRVVELEQQIAAQTRQTDAELARFQSLKTVCKEQLTLLSGWNDVFLTIR